MREVLTTLAFGFAVGAVFGFFRQPIPAPPTLAGAAGVVGVTFGFIVMVRFR